MLRASKKTRTYMGLAFLIVVVYMMMGRPNQGVSAHRKEHDRAHSRSPRFPSPGEEERGTCGRWTVVTSINTPTPSIAALWELVSSSSSSPSSSRWGLVVVGDTKSPDRNEWLDGLPGCSDHPCCEFLDIALQASLGFSTESHVPKKHYARKNVGYLYAIQQGAEIVYDTDDDNELTRSPDALGEDGFGVDLSVFAREGERSINPYVHFGQPTIWPRGFELNAIGASERVPLYTRGRGGGKPLVIQGLADGDPDVDAIFRLTRKVNDRKIHVRFDSQAPSIALAPFTYSPFNSQNTVFARDALWALYIPSTTAFRVCDIWRGYWAQRLLWEIGGSLVFARPSVFQDRNAHDYFEDYLDEKALYEDTGNLLTFLTQWRCPSGRSIFECGVSLAEGMAENGFWASSEVKGVRAWMSDLKALGLVPPSRTPLRTQLASSSSTSEPRDLDPPLKLASLATPTLDLEYVWDETLWVYVLTSPVHITALPRVFDAYKDAIPNVVVMVGEIPDGPEYAKQRAIREAYAHYIYPADLEDDYEWFTYKPFSDIIEANPSYKSYVLMHDDTMLDVPALWSLPLDQPWRASDHGWVHADDKIEWSHWDDGVAKRYKSLLDSHPDLFGIALPFWTRLPADCAKFAQDHPGSDPRHCALIGRADNYQIPARCTDDFAKYASAFHEAKIILELSVNWFLHFVCYDDVLDRPPQALSTRQGEAPGKGEAFFQWHDGATDPSANPEMLFHPIKMSKGPRGLLTSFVSDTTRMCKLVPDSCEYVDGVVQWTRDRE